MLRPRLIPVLLLKGGGLVKTTRFKGDHYIGDPLNAVRIFNEKYVDELMLIDIEATVLGREPNYGLIEKIAAECRMPLAYGGGVKSVGAVERIIGLGVEKVGISSAAFLSSSLLKDSVASVGGQSIVAVLDVKKSLLKGFEVLTHNATVKVPGKLEEIVANLECSGVGELVVNSIDRDGVMSGYDLDLAKRILDCTNVPVTFLGGAGSLSHVADLIAKCGTVGCGAGSYFVFKGKYRAVLINYPSIPEKLKAFSSAEHLGCGDFENDGSLSH